MMSASFILAIWDRTVHRYGWQVVPAFLYQVVKRLTT